MQRQPSAKMRKQLLAELSRGPYTATGSFGRLCGKLANKLNANLSDVQTLLHGDGFDISESNGVWTARLV